MTISHTSSSSLSELKHNGTTFLDTDGTTTTVKGDLAVDGNFTSLLIPKLVLKFDGTNTGTFSPDFQAGQITATVTRTGTGSYTINFSDDFANTNYVVAPASDSYNVRLQTQAVGSLQVQTSNSSAGADNTAYVSIAIWGTLA